MLKQKLLRGQTGHNISPQLDTSLESLNQISLHSSRDIEAQHEPKHFDVNLFSTINTNIAPIAPRLTPSTLLPPSQSQFQPSLLYSTPSLQSTSSTSPASPTPAKHQRGKKQPNTATNNNLDFLDDNTDAGIDSIWSALSQPQSDLSVSLILSAQSLKSINPYNELKHSFGSASVLLPPPQHHQKRLIQQIQNSPHLSQEERRRLLTIHQRQGHDSMLTPGVPVQHNALFHAHYCEQTTLLANGLTDKSQITTNTVLYYCWLTPTRRLFDDLQVLSNLQNSYDHQSTIDFSQRNLHLPQALFHLSYIFEYHNQVDHAFDWIRMAVALFENAFGSDLVPLIFSGRIRFIHSVLPNERDAIIATHQQNPIISNEFQTIQGFCNQQLLHIMNKVIARYCHFLCKKASSGSAFGLTSLALQLSNHYMILNSATELGPASYYNNHLQSTSSSAPLSPPSSLDLPLHKVSLSSLHQHLSLPATSISTNIATQYDSASLSFISDYYGLKGNRYFDVILSGLYTIPTIFGSPSNDIIPTINSNNNQSYHSTISLPNTTSLSEFFYVYSSSILYPLIQSCRNITAIPDVIPVSTRIARSIFPLCTPLPRFALNWSYSIAYAMFKLDQQFERGSQSFLTASVSPQAQLDQQIDEIVANFNLISLLSFNQLDVQPQLIHNTTPYLGLPAPHHHYQQLLLDSPSSTSTSSSALSMSSPTIHQLLTTPHVIDNSILYTALTNAQNLNTMPSKSKGINPLSSMTHPQRTMLKHLFPKQFTALAYLTRAIILFPSAIKTLLPDFNSEEYSQLTELYASAETDNGFYDKAQFVFSKRSSTLWNQTSCQLWIKAGVSCAYKMLTQFSKNELNDSTPNAFAKSLAPALCAIRSTLYNASYYSSHDYQLKHLEQSDYCDDVVRFDPNDILLPTGNAPRPPSNEPRGAQAMMAAAFRRFMGTARENSGQVPTAVATARTNNAISPDTTPTASASPIDPSLLEEFLPLIFDVQDDDDFPYGDYDFDEEFIE